MTAVNVILDDESANLVTDGAVINGRNGKLEMLCSKAHVFPHIKAAIAVRGLKLVAPEISDFVGSLGSSFDEVKECAGPRLREWMAARRRKTNPFRKASFVFDVVVAGWSDFNKRPDAYMVLTHKEHGDKEKPWEAINLGSYFFAPTNSELESEFAPQILAYGNIREVPGSGARAIQLSRIAKKMIERQRTLCAPLVGCCKPQRIVGGFAQLTTVTSGNISTRILARYDDKIGEKLGIDRPPTIRRERSLSSWMVEQAPIA